MSKMGMWGPMSMWFYGSKSTCWQRDPLPELRGKTMVSTVNFPLKRLNQSTEDWFYWNWSFDDWAGSFGGCEVSGFGSTWCVACSAPKGFGMPWISEFESRSRAPSKSMLQNHANLQPSLAVNQTICSTWIKCRWKWCLLQKAQSSFSCCSARRGFQAMARNLPAGFERNMFVIFPILNFPSLVEEVPQAKIIQSPTLVLNITLW